MKRLYRKMYRNCDKQRRIVPSSPLSFLFHCRGIWERFTPKACYHAIQGGDLSCVPRSDAMRILLFPASRNRNSVRNSVTVNNDVLNKEHCSEKKRSLSHLSSKIHIHTYIHGWFFFLFQIGPSMTGQKEGNLSAMWLSPFLSLFNREIIRVLSPSLTRSTYVERIAWIHSFARTGYHEKLVVSFFFFFSFFVPVFPLVLQHYRRRHATHAHARLTRTIYTNTREISLPLTYIYIIIIYGANLFATVINYKLFIYVREQVICTSVYACARAFQDVRKIRHVHGVRIYINIRDKCNIVQS